MILVEKKTFYFILKNFFHKSNIYKKRTLIFAISATIGIILKNFYAIDKKGAKRKHGKHKAYFSKRVSMLKFFVLFLRKPDRAWAWPIKELATISHILGALMS